jgi:membrane fusion protein, multidrug efflux system
MPLDAREVRLMSFRPTWLHFAPVAVLAVIVATSGCKGEAQPVATLPPEVAVVTVRRDPVPVTTELPGRTSAYLIAQVRARVDGIVQQRGFTEGGDVTANQRLYQIDPAPYRAAFDSAQAQLARALATVESTTAQAKRDEVLVAGNAVSKQAYINDLAAQRQAVADVAAARAAVQVAAIDLGYTDVISPISGRIGSSLVTQGAYVQASAATLLATIQQIDPIYVDLTQTSVQGLQLRNQVASGRLKLNGPDQAQVRLVLEDGTQYAHAGTLQFTDITVDPGTGSVTVRALFPNAEAVLLPGMFVRARIDHGTNDHAMLVPQVGVTHDRNGRATVLVVRHDNTVALQTVSASSTFNDSWVVDSGLNDGDRVIVGGVQKVQPGMRVRTIDAQANLQPPRLAQTRTLK